MREDEADLPMVSYQMTKRPRGIAGIQSRRQFRRRQANSTRTPTTKGSPTPEQATLATRHAKAPMSAGRLSRSSRTSAPSPPATLPRNPNWNGQRRSCHAGPSSIRTAEAGARHQRVHFPAQEEEEQPTAADIEQDKDHLKGPVVPEAHRVEQYLVHGERNHRRMPVVRLQDVMPVPRGCRLFDEIPFVEEEGEIFGRGSSSQSAAVRPAAPKTATPNQSSSRHDGCCLISSCSSSVTRDCSMRHAKGSA